MHLTGTHIEVETVQREGATERLHEPPDLDDARHKSTVRRKGPRTPGSKDPDSQANIVRAIACAGG